jgi:hypothetical protein
MRMRLLTLLLALPMLMAAQTKKPAATLDVDRLYAKYKDYETVTINTPDGPITANVKVLLNDNGKPHAVILYGSCLEKLFSNTPDVRRVKWTLESAKEKAGYSYKGFSSVYFEGHYISTSLYQKGTQYAKYGVTDIEEISADTRKLAKEANVDAYSLRVKTGEFFYFEVGDIRRRSTAKQEDFTF